MPWPSRPNPRLGRPEARQRGAHGPRDVGRRDAGSRHLGPDGRRLGDALLAVGLLLRRTADDAGAAEVGPVAVGREAEVGPQHVAALQAARPWSRDEPVVRPRAARDPDPAQLHPRARARNAGHAPGLDDRGDVALRGAGSRGDANAAANPAPAARQATRRRAISRRILDRPSRPHRGHAVVERGTRQSLGEVRQVAERRGEPALPAALEADRCRLRGRPTTGPRPAGRQRPARACRRSRCANPSTRLRWRRTTASGATERRSPARRRPGAA